MSQDDVSSSSLEEVLSRLETTIAKLADGTAPLDQLVSAHQRATGLLSEAERRLDALKIRADRLSAALQSESPTPVAASARTE